MKILKCIIWIIGIILLSNLCSGELNDDIQLWWNTINVTGNMIGSTVIDKVGLHNGTVTGLTCNANGCKSTGTGNILFTGNISQTVGTYYFIINSTSVLDKILSTYENTGNYFLAELNYPTVGKIGTSPDGGGGVASSKQNFTNNTGIKVVTLVHSGTNMWYYMNGTNVSDDTIMGDSTITTRGMGRPDGTSLFIGNILAFGIWNRTLTEDEITFLYNLGIGLSYPFSSMYINFIEPTDNNNIVKYYPENYILTNITWNNTIYNNATIYLYNSAGILIDSITTSITTPYFYNFTGLNPGTYYLNATAINITNSSSTETRTIFISTQLNMTIYNELNLSIITEEIFINLASNTSQYNYSTTTGLYYIQNVTYGKYNIKFITENYSERKYIVTIPLYTLQTLNAYMLPLTSSSNISIFIKSGAGDNIAGANIIMQRQYSGNWLTILQQETDVTGLASMNLQQGTIYNVHLTAEGYTTRTFNLEPYVINSPYTFYLSPSGVTPINYVYGIATYYITPEYNNLNQTPTDFTLTSISLNGTILYTYINCSGIGLNNGSNISGYPAGVTSTINLNLTGYEGLIECYYIISVENTDGIWLYTTYYVSNYTSMPRGSLAYVANIFKGELDDGWKVIIAFIVILAIAFTMVQLTGYGLVGTVTTFAGIVLFLVLGWLPVSISIFALIISAGLIYFQAR